MELTIDPETFPKLIHAPQSSHRLPTISNGEGDRVRAVDEGMKSESTPDAFLAKAEQRSHYDEDMRVIHLSEVEVSAKRVEKKEEPRLQYFANIGSDVTIRREEFEKRNPTTVTDLLRFVSGVSVESNGLIIIRGTFNMFGTVPPLILINGIATRWPDELIDIYDSPLEKINVLDVESIDVFKGASAAMFGVRGYGGVISITTKQGVDVRKREEYNSTVYTPLGYQRPVEFYSPKYETLESKHLTIPDYRTTIFWKPDIVVSESDEASFDFYTSDFQTTYSVVIEGLTSDGRIVRQVEKIRVE